mgnify:FL=1
MNKESIQKYPFENCSLRPYIKSQEINQHRVDGDMGDVVNLNQFRKKQGRKKAEELARNNRVRFGRTSQQKKQEKDQIQRGKTTLDQKKLSPTHDEDETTPPKN